MEEDEKWLLFSLLWFLFGILEAMQGATQKDAVSQSIGASMIFLGGFNLLERMLYGPENIAALKRRDKAMIVVINVVGSITGIAVGYFAMGPWGIFAGFVTAAIIIHLFVGVMFF